MTLPTLSSRCLKINLDAVILKDCTHWVMLQGERVAGRAEKASERASTAAQEAEDAAAKVAKNAEAENAAADSSVEQAADPMDKVKALRVSISATRMEHSVLGSTAAHVTAEVSSATTKKTAAEAQTAAAEAASEAAQRTLTDAETASTSAHSELAGAVSDKATAQKTLSQASIDQAANSERRRLAHSALAAAQVANLPRSHLLTDFLCFTGIFREGNSCVDSC